MSRIAKHYHVIYVEEPVFDSEANFLDSTLSVEGVWIVVPHLQRHLNEVAVQKFLNVSLRQLFDSLQIKEYFFWYYTPMALSFSDNFTPALVVYDCMDELSAFKNAPVQLKEKEKELMLKADIMFTGGYSLFEAKRYQHAHIFPFPSSVDKKHFGKSRNLHDEPQDQQSIPHPRIGFFGVIDERFDIELLAFAADTRPDLHFIMVGPTVKIDPATLPTQSNIHYLGIKQYEELPAYLAGWDVAMMPFAINESTKFISPTKTLEYLAGGKPVVSTAITDVVNPYGDRGLVYIAHTQPEFIYGIEEGLALKNDAQWILAVDTFLAKNSWDDTADKMIYLINSALSLKLDGTIKREENEYV